VIALAEIEGFHAHVYFDAETRVVAERLQRALAQDLGVTPSRIHDRPIGPHGKPMFQITMAPEQFATIVPWLMVNRDGLSVLVHPTTRDLMADHTTRPLWMGEVVPMNEEFVQRNMADRQHA
jgi:DOPA 4,5-dioxygenase